MTHLSCGTYDKANPSAEVAKEVIDKMQLDDTAIPGLSVPRAVLRAQSLFSHSVKTVLRKREEVEKAIEEHRQAYVDAKRMGNYMPDQTSVRAAIIDLLGEPDKASL